MTNAQIIATLSKRLISRASQIQADLGLTYAQARGRLQAESVAGPAVWSIVDAHFAKPAPAPAAPGRLYITKSRAGHYTPTVRSPFGAKACGLKSSTVEQARAQVPELRARLAAALAALVTPAEFAAEDDEALAPAPFMWAICSCCAGAGRVDNPAFSNGFTSSEWADLDGDERDAYMSGTYDVPCGACQGSGKVQLPDVARMTYAQKRRLAAQRRDERDRALYAAEAAAERRAGC